jgi:hypothetical protein
VRSRSATAGRGVTQLGLALSALLGAACINQYPQRVPGPLFLAPEDELAPVPRGPARITVQRNSDPVWVRRPGERGDVPLPFYRKRERVSTGTRVRTGAGGRAEILWSPDATSLVLFDEGRVTLGDPERDEPVMRLHSLTRAVLVLTPEDRVVLTGGARLSGDPLETTGPVLLELTNSSMLRVTNQSKGMLSIAFREQLLELGPGESADLPPLAGGAEPTRGVEPSRLEASGIPLAYEGELEHEAAGAGLRVCALSPCRIEALGVELRLAAEETVVFSGLSQGSAAPPADRNPVP